MFLYIEQFRKHGSFVVATIALLMLSVVPFYVNADFHDTQRLISTIFVAAALCLTIGSARVSQISVGLLTVSYMWGMVAVASSPLPLWSIVEFGLLFSTVLIGICLMPKLDSAQLLHLALLLAVIHGFYILHNLTDYTMYMVTGSQFDPYSLANGFSNVRFYGQFLVWTVPFLLGTLTVNLKLPYRKVLIVLLMFDWAFEFLALTRAFLVAMVITLPFVLWISKDRFRDYAKWFFITALGGGVLYVLMLFVIPKFFGLDSHFAFMHSAGRSMLNSSGRKELWAEAFQQVLEHPWLGIGPMMTALSSVSNTSAHPHNFALQLFAEWGIPFTTLLLSGATVGFVRWRKMIRAHPSERIDFALPVTASLVAGATAGLFDGLIVMPVSLTYMAIMFAVLGCLWRQWTPSVDRKRFPAWMLPILLMPPIFVAVFAVANWSYWTSNASAVLIISGSENQLFTKLNPRFWMAGHVSLEKVRR
jgi:putative inorganic carbon (hco3(-)) transporter